MKENFEMRYASMEKLINNIEEMKKDGWTPGKIIEEIGAISEGVKSFSCNLTRATDTVELQGKWNGWLPGKIGVIDEDTRPLSCSFTRNTTKLQGIWKDSYVCELGILEHCNEISSLQSELCVQKALKSEPRSVEKLKRTLRHEQIDLMLILQAKGFSDDEIEERAKRFIEKANENKEGK